MRQMNAVGSMPGIMLDEDDDPAAVDAAAPSPPPPPPLAAVAEEADPAAVETARPLADDADPVVGSTEALREFCVPDTVLDEEPDRLGGWGLVEEGVVALDDPPVPVPDPDPGPGSVLDDPPFAGAPLDFCLLEEVDGLSWWRCCCCCGRCCLPTLSLTPLLFSGLLSPPPCEVLLRDLLSLESW